MQDQKESDKTVYVGNLGSSVKEEILFELFLQAGPLKRVTIPKDHEGRQRSYGFVFYKHAEAVPYAIALLNGTWLNGLQIKLHYYSGSSYQDNGCGHQDTDNDGGDSSLNTSANGSHICLSLTPPCLPPHPFWPVQLPHTMDGLRYKPCALAKDSPPCCLAPPYQTLGWISKVKGNLEKNPDG
ncbi:RNA binding motif protein 11 [Aplochiton taeniatus]